MGSNPSTTSGTTEVLLTKVPLLPRRCTLLHSVSVEKAFHTVYCGVVCLRVTTLLIYHSYLYCIFSRTVFKQVLNDLQHDILIINLLTGG